MWVDYALYLTTGLVLLAAIVLIVVVVRKRARAGLVIALLLLLVVGLLGIALVRPERFREPGEELLIVEVDGSLQTDVAMIGQCLSLFRKIGPLSFIVANDVVPGEDWERRPFNGCEGVGLLGAHIYLPESVRSGCGDFATCFPLAREA